MQVQYGDCPQDRKRSQRGGSEHDLVVTPLAKRPKNADLVIKAVTSTPPPVVGTQTDTKLMVQTIYSSTWLSPAPNWVNLITNMVVSFVKTFSRDPHSPGVWIGVTIKLVKPKKQLPFVLLR